jgi:hypothetical protein
MTRAGHAGSIAKPRVLSLGCEGHGRDPAAPLAPVTYLGES